MIMVASECFSPLSRLGQPPLGRWLYVGLTLLSVLLAACDSARAGEDTPYAAEEVVYDQPLHGSYATRRSELSRAAPLTSGELPRIEVADDFVDFGRVPADEQVETTFVIRNSGNSTLNIMRLYTTCEYMFADLSGSVIPPGRVALLVVTLNLTHSDADQGLLRRGAILESNDPQQPETTVWVQLRVER